MGKEQTAIFYMPDRCVPDNNRHNTVGGSFGDHSNPPLNGI